MAFPRSEVIRFVSLFSQHRNLKVTMTESLKGAAITGLGALVGGLLGGPRGLAVGGITGAVFAGISGSGKYKSAIEVIMEDMTEVQREELANSVMTALRGVNWASVASATTLMTLVSQDDVLEGAVIDVMRSFFSDMGMSLTF